MKFRSVNAAHSHPGRTLAFAGWRVRSVPVVNLVLEYIYLVLEYIYILEDEIDESSVAKCLRSLRLCSVACRAPRAPLEPWRPKEPVWRRFIP